MNIPSQITVNWDVYDPNKTWKKKCGHEVSGLDCIIIIPGPEELTPEEDALIEEKMRDLCTPCFEEWKKGFWAAKTGVLNEEYKLTFNMELQTNILRGFPPSNSISPIIRIKPQDFATLYP